MIDRLEITRYPRGPGAYRAESRDMPTWDLVEAELRSMDSFEKPILALLKNREWPDSVLMFVNGGDGVYHIQIADEDARWSEAFDPGGSDEIVDVWISDQGFSTERKNTWAFDDACVIVRHYFETGKPHPGYSWR